LFIKDLKDWGVDNLIVCEPHNIANTQKFCDQWGVKLFVCNPRQIFARVINPLVLTLGAENVRVYSPDFGSVCRALEMARLLGCRVLASAKLRTETGIELVEDTQFLTRVYEKYGQDVPVSCDLSECAGLHIFMQEDELATGRTSEETAGRLREYGAQSVRLIVTHPVCTPGWKMALFPRHRPQPFAIVWLGNTRPRGIDQTEYQGSTGGRVEKVRVESAMAETLIKVMEEITD
jgi:phosphoribosylpyrophosphate synthetase